MRHSPSPTVKAAVRLPPLHVIGCIPRVAFTPPCSCSFCHIQQQYVLGKLADSGRACCELCHLGLNLMR